jgi:TRAP-type mannitol/chloroaromatic compound transport system substrate-binding protein
MRFALIKQTWDEITEASGGRLVIDVYPAGGITRLGEEPEAIDQGVLDAGSTSHSFWMKWHPAAGLLYVMAGGHTAMQQFLWYQGGEGIELMQQTIDEPGLNAVAVAQITIVPPEVWAHSNEPLETPADLDGKKFRAAGEVAEILETMGCSTTFIPGDEIYESMQRGVIDIFEMAPPAVQWSMGFQEVAKYLYISPSRQASDSHWFYVNRDKWQELPDDLKLMVKRMCQAGAVQTYVELLAAEGEALQKFTDYGCIVQPLPQAIEDAFAVKAREFYDRRAQEEGGLYPVIVKAVRDSKAYFEARGVY